MKNKNKKQLDSFIKYCRKHPEERFWQALRNWSGYAYILKAEGYNYVTRELENTEDTFFKD